MANLNHEDRANSTTAGSISEAVFALNGEFWSIGYRGRTFPIKASKGLAYIHRLLQSDGTELHALDLLSGPDNAGLIGESPNLERYSTDSTLSIGRLGDSGEMLDGKAKQDYRRRLIELRQEQEDARELGNDERAAEIDSEIDFLAREISRAVGLGGRDRRAGSAAERARLNVSRAIKSAVQKISQHDAEFGEWLDRSIRTGSFCSFAGHGQTQIKWHFSGETFQSELEPTESAPFQPKPFPSLLQITKGRTSFVGRDKEREALRRSLDMAQSGRGSMAVVAGPPGIGKTRLAGEIGTEAAERGFLTLAGACYERDDSVPFNPFVEILESARGQMPEEAFRRMIGDALGELGRLVPQLRRDWGDAPAVGDLSAEQSRRLLLSAFVEFLVRLANNTPVLLVVDDLQWGDEGTFSLLSHIARSVSTTSVFIVGTYRDSESDRSEGLDALLETFTRLHALQQINLSNLTKVATAEMIAAVERQVPSKEVADLIYTGSEGNPFFIEELLQHLVERGEIVESNGSLRLRLKVDALDVPGSLRLVIGRRLARLSRETRRLLDTAAVIGRSFTFDLLEASSGVDTDSLLDLLEEAEVSGLISSTFEYPQARFQFSHDLIRQCVLADLFAPRRQRLHFRIATAIEGIDSQPIETKINDLAYHMWNAGSAGDPIKTIGYLRKAAEKARVQSAYDTALSDLRNALQMLGQILDTVDRAKLELELSIEYLQVLSITNRWTTTEGGKLYARARKLSESLGQSARMYRMLQGSAVFHLGRSELELTQDYSRRILELSESSSKPEWAISANYLLGHASCCRGDFVEAHDRLTEAVRLRNSMPASSNGGRSARIFSLGIDSLALWMLGYPDLALSKAYEGVEAATESKNSYDQVFALVQLHELVMFRREYSTALEIVERAIRIAAEKKFEWLETSAIWSRDACRILAGMSDGIDRVQKAFDAYFASEAKLYRPTNCTVLAECCGVLGQPDLGLAMIDEAVSCMAETDERMTEAETWRVKGELVLRLAAKADRPSRALGSPREEAEACFRSAIAIAHEQKSKIWELRATVSLATLLAGSKRRSEAQVALARIYGWFSEGIDTPDLQQARALVEELSS